ncbi:MAG: hypothetical protein V2I51_06515, partial [Anderseniella sp.]|nr:hypothetical protein [Anderseniella sp.]
MLGVNILDVPAALYFPHYPNDPPFAKPLSAHLGFLGNIFCLQPLVLRGPILRVGYKSVYWSHRKLPLYLLGCPFNSVCDYRRNEEQEEIKI